MPCFNRPGKLRGGYCVSVLEDWATRLLRPLALQQWLQSSKGGSAGLSRLRTCQGVNTCSIPWFDALVVQRRGGGFAPDEYFEDTGF